MSTAGGGGCPRGGGGVLTLEQRLPGRVLDIVHGRSRMTIHPRTPTMPGRSTRVFIDQVDIAFFVPSVKHRREVFGESHEGDLHTTENERLMRRIHGVRVMSTEGEGLYNVFGGTEGMNQDVLLQ